MQWNPPRAYPIWGVITKVSDLNKRIACATALLNVTEVRASDPSSTKILDILAHFRQAFLKLETNNIQ